jgi:hypothetical protein
MKRGQYLQQTRQATKEPQKSLQILTPALDMTTPRGIYEDERQVFLLDKNSVSEDQGKGKLFGFMPHKEHGPNLK